MRLRNKKTGEIADEEGFYLYRPHNSECWGLGIKGKTYDTLAELNEEWEDYEKPKDYWYIDSDGEILCEPADDRCKFDMDCKQIGNYFETEEEAEKAVEKLKAWKRLKDKGFKFTGWDRHPDYPGDFRITASDEWSVDDKDLDLLFGGEE